MKSRSRDVQVFSVSFLDVLSCALGGTLILLLLLQQSKSEAQQERDQARNELQDQLATEFWVLSIHVTQTADADGNRTPEDFHVNYYVSLSYEGNEVTGQLFGVQDIDRAGETDSFGQANIEGTRSGNRITFDLVYQGEAEGDIERVEATLPEDGKMKGDLSSAASLPTHRGYEGPLTGTRLTP